MTSTVTQYLTGLDSPFAEIGTRMRAVITAALPDANEAMFHGHPVWSLGEKPGHNPICLLKGYKSYLTFGLWRGRELNDPTGELIPGARAMASVKLRTLGDIDEAGFTALLEQAHDLESRAVHQ